MRRKIALALIGCFLVGISLAHSGILAQGTNDFQHYMEGIVESHETGGTFYIYKNGELIAKQHNVLMEGEEAIESQIKQSSSNYQWDYLTLGNGTAPGGSSTTLDSEWASCGMSPAQANVADNGDGNWTLDYTWTATCGTDSSPIKINTTAIYSNGATTDIDYFAGTDFGRTIEAITDDQLTVEYRSAVQ